MSSPISFSRNPIELHLLHLRDGSTLGQRGAIAPPPPPIKKKTSIKKLSFALIYMYIYLFVYPTLKYLDIDLQENK